jgi:hypothetical protein
MVKWLRQRFAELRNPENLILDHPTAETLNDLTDASAIHCCMCGAVISEGEQVKGYDRRRARLAYGVGYLDEGRIALGCSSGECALRSDGFFAGLWQDGRLHERADSACG